MIYELEDRNIFFKANRRLSPYGGAACGVIILKASVSDDSLLYAYIISYASNLSRGESFIRF